jgi:lipoprotein-anchoring transpeptidase ErfK/SrfK
VMSLDPLSGNPNTFYGLTTKDLKYVGLGAVGVCFGMGFLGSLALRLISITPDQGHFVRPDTSVRVRYFGIPGQYSVSIDGKLMPASFSLMHQTIECEVRGLGEGEHQLKVELTSPISHAEQTVVFTVDSKPPEIKLGAVPSYLAQSQFEIRGRSEANGAVQLYRKDPSSKLEQLQQVPVISSGDAKGLADFQISAPVKAGWNSFALIAVDRAGNQTEKGLRIFGDQSPPEVRVGRLVKGQLANLESLEIENSKFKLRLTANDDSGTLTGAKVWLDDEKEKSVALKKQVDGSYTSEWIVENQPEGLRKLNFRVTDKSGRVQTGAVTFLVNSSERLGERPMTLGAKGKDVEQLQEKLEELKFFTGESTGVLDEATAEAIKAFQADQGFPITGKVDAQTLASLGPRILVNLSRCSLVLDRPGHELKRYAVAVGAPSFPTPPGKYKIVYKEMNPTWMPPDSAWAKEAKSIPPGPGNPLGTRWIGLDSGSVGIHGTNADWSIGTAASHGCVRMHIPEVEELYELVEAGYPVYIYSGNEGVPEIKKYWP